MYKLPNKQTKTIIDYDLMHGSYEKTIETELTLIGVLHDTFR